MAELKIHPFGRRWLARLRNMTLTIREPDGTPVKSTSIADLCVGLGGRPQRCTARLSEFVGDCRGM